MRKLAYAPLLVALVALPRVASASHFRFGQIVYTIDPSDPKLVHFDVYSAWRTAFVGCNTLNFGDGAATTCDVGAVTGTTTDPNGDSITYTKAHHDHTYAAPGSYTAFFESCCRLSTLTVGADDSFRVEAIVDATLGNTGNARATVPAIVALQTGGTRSFLIPAADNEGPVSCRFTTQTENLSFPMPPVVPGGNAPTIASSPNGCVITWNTVAATSGQLYPLSVAVESHNALNNHLSKTTLDFMVFMTAAPPPTCSPAVTNLTAPIGLSSMASFTGTVVGGGAASVSGLFDAGVLTPASGTTGASPFTVSYAYTPTAADVGVHTGAVVFTMPNNLTGYCPFLATVPACPAYGTPCDTGVGECHADGILQCDAVGSVSCSAVAGMPTAEVCDGLDNDCDGTADQGFNVGAGCTSGVGACEAAGAIVCDAMGGAACDATEGSPITETCDGVDNDCNGTLDDGFGVGDACTVGVGACANSGAMVCDAMGGSVCDATPLPPSAEICGNGVDEDCDGADLPCGSGGAGGSTATSSGATSGSASSTTAGSSVSTGSGATSSSSTGVGGGDGTDSGADGCQCRAGGGDADPPELAWLVAALGLGSARRRRAKRSPGARSL